MLKILRNERKCLSLLGVLKIKREERTKKEVIFYENKQIIYFC